MTLYLANVNETQFLSLGIFLAKCFTAIVYFYGIAEDEPVCPVIQECLLSSSSCSEGVQLRQGKKQLGGQRGKWETRWESEGCSRVHSPRGEQAVPLPVSLQFH